MRPDFTARPRRTRAEEHHAITELTRRITRVRSRRTMRVRSRRTTRVHTTPVRLTRTTPVRLTRTTRVRTTPVRLTRTTPGAHHPGSPHPHHPGVATTPVRLTRTTRVTGRGIPTLGRRAQALRRGQVPDGAGHARAVPWPTGDRRSGSRWIDHRRDLRLSAWHLGSGSRRGGHGPGWPGRGTGLRGERDGSVVSPW